MLIAVHGSMHTELKNKIGVSNGLKFKTLNDPIISQNAAQLQQLAVQGYHHSGFHSIQ